MSYNQVGGFFDWGTNENTTGTNEATAKDELPGVVVKDEIPGASQHDLSIVGTAAAGGAASGGVVGALSSIFTSVFSGAAKVIKKAGQTITGTPIVADTSATPPTAGSGGFLDSKIVGIPMPVALVGVAITAYYFKSKKKRRGRRR